jgi:cytochrome P450
LPDTGDLGHRVSDFERGFGSATRLTSFAEVDEVFRSGDFAPGSHIDGHPSAFLFNGSLATVDGAEHFDRRRLEAALLRKPVLAQLENDLLPSALEHQFESVRRNRGPDGVAHADLLKILRGGLIPLAAAIVGLDDLETDQSIEALRTSLLKISEGSSIRWGVRPIEESISSAMDGKATFVRDYFRPAWSRRQQLVGEVDAGRRDRSDLPNDLITLLITSPIAGWDEDVNVREVLLFFTGAANTPALVTPHVVYDVLTWLAAHPRETELVTGPQREEFLWRCLLESLRLHLEVPAHFRMASHPVRLRSGRRVRAEEVIALDIVAASRDPSIFGPDANEFNPHRPAPARGMAFGFAFGGGAHTCIGRELMVGPATGEILQPSASRGVLGKLLMEMFGRGIRLDPDRPPRLSPDRTRPEYAEFAVLFDSP